MSSFDGSLEHPGTVNSPQKPEDTEMSPKQDIPGVNHTRAKKSPPKHLHTRLSPLAHRPLTTHTTLGSPINTRLRSQSLGSLPPSWNVGRHQFSPRSVPVSPVMGTTSSSPLLFPTMPSLPPEHSETQKAMEAAAAKERERAKKLEEEELTMNADELRAVLKRERHRTGKIAADLAALRSTAVQSQLEAEVIEEGRINGLMRRLDNLQQEKGRIIIELEREEELVSGVQTGHSSLERSYSATTHALCSNDVFSVSLLRTGTVQTSSPTRCKRS